jgi:hypothetical protein
LVFIESLHYHECTLVEPTNTKTVTLCSRNQVWSDTTAVTCSDLPCSGINSV